MGSFGAPTKNLGSRSLPQLRPSPSKAAAFRGSEAKRLKLEALRRANDDDKLARAKRAAAMARRVATPLRKSAHFPGEAAATVIDPQHGNESCSAGLGLAGVELIASCLVDSRRARVCVCTGARPPAPPRHERGARSRAPARTRRPVAAAAPAAAPPPL